MAISFCIKKKTIILLLLWNILCILSLAVTLIAVKREVAVLLQGAGFPWSECQGREQRLTNWRQVTVPKESVNKAEKRV